MPAFAFETRTPVVATDALVAPTACLIGAVTVESYASIWFGAVLRADFASISVGEGTSIQDNVVIHTADGLPTSIGCDVTVGHGALLEGCDVEDGAVIGMGAIVLHRARIGEGAMVAAGSVVREGQQIPPGFLAAGVPAEIKKSIDGASRLWTQEAAQAYRDLTLRYGGSFNIVREG